MPKELIDPRNNTSEVCACCGVEYDNRRGGTSGQTYHAENENRDLCLCEDCCVEFVDETRDTGFDHASLDTDTLSLKDFDTLTAWAKKGRVLTFCEPPIKTREDVENFFDALSALISWHPDTDFANYISLPSGDELFDERQSTELNTRMQEAFEVCDKIDRVNKASEGLIYTLALESAQRAGWAPKNNAAKEKPHPEDTGKLSKLKQTQAVLKDLAEWMIEARNGDDTQENNSGAIHGGVMHELLTRANKVLGETLPHFD